MLQFHEALAAVLNAGKAAGSETIALHAALGRVLASDVFAPISHPIFDQTAVDGYALRFADLAGGQPLRIVDMIRAGDSGERGLGTGECSRIFTGAPLPPGADTTVMQELTRREGDALHVLDEGLKRGGNVRLAGEQIRAGALALAQGATLNPGAIGFLASLGIRAVEVVRQPQVSIIVTGDEFAENEYDFRRGKIFESNGQMLQAAFAAQGIAVKFQTCVDDLATLKAMVATESATCDLLILTGGVSVGDYDFSRAALEANGFDVVFHDVRQKPGKPLLFCQRGPQFAFGLPGNPRASLMCFYIYVLALMDRLQGKAKIGLPTLTLPLQHDYRRRPDGKTHFLTGRILDNQINLLEGQQSHMLQSFAEADVIVILDANEKEFAAGRPMQCYLLP